MKEEEIFHFLRHLPRLQPFDTHDPAIFHAIQNSVFLKARRAGRLRFWPYDHFHLSVQTDIQTVLSDSSPAVPDNRCKNTVPPRNQKRYTPGPEEVFPDPEETPIRYGSFRP